MAEYDVEGAFEAIDGLAWLCVSVMYEAWEDAYGTFNAGQQSIYESYVMDALEEFTEEVEANWPDVDAYAYVDLVYESYDPSVIDQAFSVTTMEPVAQMEQIIGTAQAISYFLDFIGAL